MQSEWQQRLDFLLVILVVVVVTFLVWQLLGPHFLAFGTAVVTTITDAVGAVQGLTKR